MKWNRILLNVLILNGLLLIILSVFQNDPILSCIELIIGIFLFTYNLCVLLINVAVKSLLEVYLESKVKFK